DLRVHAARDLVAGVGGAGVLVVALDRRVLAAGGGVAAVGRAGVVVVAAPRGVGAAARRGAALDGAGVVVVPIQPRGRCVDAVVAGLGAVAALSLAAARPICDLRVHAARDLVAGVGGAGVLVVAVDRRVLAAGGGIAAVGCAGVVVVAAPRGVDTARLRA